MSFAGRHAAFHGTSRFEIVRELGKGASGTVYEVFDRTRKLPVALKTLTELSPDVRYRFKREFRALTDVHDEHLVELFELVADDDVWFFTMELIVGDAFMSYLRPGSVRRDSLRTGLRAANSNAGLDTPSDPPLSGTLDMGRLRSSFVQLCQGLDALHDAGLLHRDIKPSNVLVTQNGRVVLVDFGIVAELHHAASRSTDLTALVGTPAYMAPEQGTGEPVTEATDWYAVGVMLFEALTGRLPFTGNALDLLTAKIETQAPRARDFAPDVPEDLDALCGALLSRDAAERPGFAEIMRRLGTSQPVQVATEQAEAPIFVGREDELKGLAAALSEVRPGHPVVLHVPGTSGMGKSTLLRHFLDDVASRDRALVFAGRCCERESVPFKALDDAIDALALHLAELPAHELPRLLPGGAAALVRIFPVFAQVSSFEKASGEAAFMESNDWLVRTRAVAALRALLGHLARTRPVVLSIDDAQWGDDDSAALLAELTAPPGPPGMLVVLAYRKEWAGRAPLLMPRTVSWGVEVPLRSVAVDPLPEPRARLLAAHWLERAPDDPAVGTIVAEAAGSPFVLMEFARHMRAAGMPSQGLNLAEVMRARLAQLDDGPRRLLEALAVAARPLDPVVVGRAAGLSPELSAAAVRALRQAHLVRHSDVRSGALRVETFHDRVRETLVAGLDEASLRKQHEQFVSALTELDSDDVEALYQHCRGAGQKARATDYALLAARDAQRSLAFVRAAELFGAALELSAGQDERAQTWRVSRAEALACAGRRKDAAEAFLGAAHALPAGSEARSLLECSAVEQYLTGGHFDLGMPIAESTLRSVGMPLAESRNAALLSMGARLGWLRLRGTGFREREESQVPREQLAQIDAALRVAHGVGLTDPIRAGELFLRTTLRALKAGEIKRVAGGLSCLTTMMAAEGPSAHGERLLAQTLELATRSNDAPTLAEATMINGYVHAFHGQWRLALGKLERADELYQALPGLGTADHQNTRSLILLVRYFLGHMRELCQRVPAAVADAAQRGDAYTRGLLTTSKASLCWLALDQPETHAELMRTGITSKPRDNALCIEHVTGMVNYVDNCLYVGDHERAAATLADTLPKARASLMLRMIITATQSHDVQGRTALLSACASHEAPENRKLALREASALAKLRLPWPVATAILLRAGEADVAGRAEDAVRLYRQAAAAFDAADMALHGAVARLRLGQWLLGDEGRTLSQSAERWMREQGVVAPARMAMMMAPSTRT